MNKFFHLYGSTMSDEGVLDEIVILDVDDGLRLPERIHWAVLLLQLRDVLVEILNGVLFWGIGPQ